MMMGERGKEREVTKRRGREGKERREKGRKGEEEKVRKGERRDERHRGGFRWHREEEERRQSKPEYVDQSNAANRWDV